MHLRRSFIHKIFFMKTICKIIMFFLLFKMHWCNEKYITFQISTFCDFNKAEGPVAIPEMSV